MAALFSCTKCHKRYPFDELSQGEQLCKECRNNYPTVKCTYCRAEFQQNSKGSTSSICAKCAQNVKHYGKPTACENCSVLAAFIGNRCQRCVNSEKKWGPPMVCEQCKLKCAFDRPERRKVDGKLMCWLCDQAYKRVLAKTRKSQDIILKTSRSSSSLIDTSSKSNTPTNNGEKFSSNQPSSGSFEGMTVLERLTKLATSGGSSRGNTPPVEAKQEGENRSVEKVGSAGEEDIKEDKEKPRSHNRHHHRKHHHHHHRSSHSKRHHQKEEEESSDAKKQKAEKNSTNGVTAPANPAAAATVSTPKSSGSTISETGMDTATSENVILITQLREQIESLKKQMSNKDQQLLEKDKKITELKAQMYESDKEFRSKVQAMQRGHATAIETLQIKNRELTRQVSSLTKSKKSVEPTSLTLGTS
ncbi:protein FAM76A [Biomphalaria pfeifferi]|uniref:Protein FAM76A n=1 Tax=Biomphalaria pfeifferi TaxID=112525 RepID=A0AAD8B024_BIOPF|nr:protein FAM76A [Biomphalaria pfeifferi]